MRTRRVGVLLAGGAMTLSAGGCGQLDLRPEPSTSRPPCAQPTRHELGFVQAAGGPWPSFRTTGGEVYVGVRGLDRDTALGPVRSTRMSLVDARRQPKFREDTSVVLNAVVAADVRPGGLVKVRVPAGRFDVVSSNYGELWLETCADGLVGEVQVAQPAGGAGQ